MLSSSPTSFAHPFLSSSPPLSPITPPSRSARISPSHLVSATASCSYTCAEDSPRLRQIPPRLMTANASLYEILEVPIGATGQEIKSAYRKLARICHPDVAGTDRTSSAEEFMKIHAAYCTLSDPEKRSVYDRRMLRRSRPLTVATSGLGSYVGRNWETDQCW